MDNRTVISNSPDETFALGESLGRSLQGGEIVLLEGGLGAGKTLLTKGIVTALDFDQDDVNSPSFTLVNLYKAPAFDVYHIDLWRTEPGIDVGFAVGLDEILLDETAVVIIEWSDRLDRVPPDRIIYSVRVSGDGEEPRTIEITQQEHLTPSSV